VMTVLAADTQASTILEVIVDLTGRVSVENLD
jgi:hypothetical protein